MAKLSQYKIDLEKISDSVATYSYELDQEFFDSINHVEVQKGNVEVTLTIRKRIVSYEFNFHLFGTVQIPCDRCLDEMDQEIDTYNRLEVKLGQEYSEESDEVVIIPEDESTINIAWYLYEFIVLNIPIKHVHEPGKCNKDMAAKLQEHQAVEVSDDDDNDDVLNDEDSSDDQDTDPRWDELKKLRK